MQDEEKLDKVLERFYNRYNKFNTKTLQMLGSVIKQFDGISPSQAHILAQELKLGFDVYKLQQELSKISGKSIQDIDKLFDKVAKENVEFSEVYYKAKNKEYVKYEDNEPLQDMVEAIKKQTNNTFTNLANSKNTGFVLEDKDGNKTFKTIPQVYNNLIDEAVYNVETGVSDYQSAMRNTIRQLADSGVKIHEEKLGYASGYNRRIDSSVRQDVLTGLRQVNIGIQEEIGAEIGADGVEVSHHMDCAPDHYEIDGRQFTKDQFERINSNLDRPVGQYNCRHFIFSIILGVNRPNYTKKQLARDRKQNEKGFDYEGKHYTNYEGTQLMRKMETVIRKNKDLQITARASGNDELISKAQKNISILMSKYNEISKVSGINTYKNRISVTGYHRLKSYDK